MDYNTGDIDFERVAMLLSVVKDCAGVGPQLMSISSAAMHELVDMNKELSDRQTEAGKKRIADEQARAAELSQPPVSEYIPPNPHPSNDDANIDVRRV